MTKATAATVSKTAAKPKSKLARARTILTNFIAKNGSLPERKKAMALLRKRLDVTPAQSSTYFNMIRKELLTGEDVQVEAEVTETSAAA